MNTHKTLSNPIIVGLDLGTTKTVVIVGQRNDHGKIEILGCGKSESKGMNEAEAVNILDVAMSIKEALNLCYQSNPTIFLDPQTDKYAGINEVIVGIAGKHISCAQHSVTVHRKKTDREITLEEIETLRLDQYNQYVTPGNRIINVIPQTYKIDQRHTVLNPVGCAARRIDVCYNLITGNEDEIEKICRAVEKAGLKTMELYLQPLASAMSVLTDAHKKSGVVMVDIGGGTTDIAVFKGGYLLHTAVINLAGNFITNDIFNNLRLFRYEEAEALKVNYGSCIPDLVKPSMNVIFPEEKGLSQRKISLYQLSLNINRSVVEIIKHINSNLRNSGIDLKQLTSGIVMSGGGALLSHLKQLVAHETELDTRIGLPNAHLAAGYDKELEHPEFATCYGLILYGFELFDNQMKQFIQEDEEEVPQKEDILPIKKDPDTIMPPLTEPLNAQPPHPKPKGGMTNYISDLFRTVKQEFDGADNKL